MQRKAILLSEKDNVAVAITNLHKGDVVELDKMKFIVEEDIDFGHKISLTDIKIGQDIIKYGEIIGRATQEIPMGHHVHVHNIKSLRANKND
ncbi:MAG: UxaA family hydrolase [Thermoplasmatales archaeon]